MHDDLSWGPRPHGRPQPYSCTQDTLMSPKPEEKLAGSRKSQDKAGGSAPEHPLTSPAWPQAPHPQPREEDCLGLGHGFCFTDS